MMSEFYGFATLEFQALLEATNGTNVKVKKFSFYTNWVNDIGEDKVTGNRVCVFVLGYTQSKTNRSSRIKPHIVRYIGKDETAPLLLWL